jgi:hypothetical protein
MTWPLCILSIEMMPSLVTVQCTRNAVSNLTKANDGKGNLSFLYNVYILFGCIPLIFHISKNHNNFC